ncbi:MAG: NACHT domain-containing protein [Guyparkeria sp.]
MASELDTPSQKFDRALFNKALDEGKLYLILDGFDEVEIQRQKDLANEITDLSSKCHKNTIIITSRPQETLPKLSHGVSVQFDYFTRTQAISLLERYDKIAKLDIGKRLIREIDSVPERFIESPLLVSLLYRTFGVNNSIATQIITFYDEIYDALYKGHDLINKNGYAREKLSGLNFEEFRIFLRSLCYYMMLKRKTTFANSSEAFNYINFAIELSGVSPTSPQNFLQDLLVCVPLMQRDGVEIKFIHKTIIEYFAAEHIVYDKNSEELPRKLFLSSISAGLDQTFDFIYEMNRDLFNHVITSHFASQAPLDQLETANELKRSLTTLTFLKRCKVGIWDKDKYSQPRPGGRRQKIFSFEKAGEKHDEFMSFVWDETTISRHDYYIVFALGDTPDNFHERAWESIKEDYPGFTKSNPNEFSADCANQLSQIIKKDQWHDLTPDLINKISTLGYKDSILDLAETSITSNRLGRSLKPGVLSAKKIKLLLSRASRQNQIAKELDGLIN